MLITAFKFFVALQHFLKIIYDKLYIIAFLTADFSYCFSVIFDESNYN